MTNTWLRREKDNDQTVNDLQPLRHESDSFFDFDCELESPGSPVDECEYLRLIETASNTPHNSVTESGYVCTSVASSNSSNDGPFFDVINSEDHPTIEIQPAPSALLVPKINGTLCNDDTKLTILENGYENRSSNTTDDIDLIDVQQQIIKELQAQSEQITNAIENQEKIANITSSTTTTTTTIIIPPPPPPTAATTAAATTTTITTNQTDETIVSTLNDIKNIVVNGHAQTAEDNMQIVMTENALMAISTEATDTTEKAETIKKDAIEISENKRRDIFAHSGLDTTDDEDECRPQRVRRCSSLKTGKTPPGTPGRKKIVRFADKLGFDLADIKTFLDEIPNIPKSAFEDLEINDTEPPIQLGPKADKLLMPLFQQPGGLPTFLDLVRERQVSLENAAVTDHINQTITGSVRVRNLDFNKSVHIRYTLDHWRSFADLQANYVINSCDGFSDKFTFVIFGNSMHIGQRLEFAVRFQCKGQQFWDNNYGINYCFQCLPATSPLTAAHTSLQPAVMPTTGMGVHHQHAHNGHDHAHAHGHGHGHNHGHGHGHDHDHGQGQGQSHVMGLLSPTASDSWCSSFY